MDRPTYLNLVPDHSTLLLSPRAYRMYYLLLRVLFKLSPEDIVYNVRSRDGNDSMTFAVRIGCDDVTEDRGLKQTLYAVVQPTEGETEHSHVREMLASHKTSALWQHQALRTPDLFALHDHLRARGVNFITPILADEKEDLLQVFTGEIFAPGEDPSGVFFEFVQRKITPELKERLATHNRETFFKDDTFLGLYAVKQREYESGIVVPFINHALFCATEELFLAYKKQPDITEEDVIGAEQFMIGYIEELNELHMK